VIPKECKRLAEVDFPIAEVSRHAVREKSIRQGHPSTLHLWWARRPLASSRAVLMALLLPDPCDEHCPNEFKEQARHILREVRQPPTTDAELRKALLRFIGTFANWDLAAEPTYVRVARNLVKAAHGDEAPLVVDPFAGGGSIPLEALRIGCEAFASDLNPVACLILKVMLEDIPRHGASLADELRRLGAEITRQAEQELADLYPTDPDGATPVAYLWARTVRCEAPDCGAEIPLMRSFWLCKKKNRRWALRPRVERHDGSQPTVEFEVFEPKATEDVHGSTVTRAKASCLCCNAVLPPERVRAQLAAQRGGADMIFDDDGERTGGARMIAVVTLTPGEKGRYYRLPNHVDYKAVRLSQVRLAEIMNEWKRNGKRDLCPIPDEPLPPIGTLGFRVQRYGMVQWGDLFTSRQKFALAVLGRHIQLTDTSNSLRRLLACVLGVFCRACNSNARLRPDSSVAPAFGMQTLPITWTFPETILTGGRSEHFDGAITKVARIIEEFPLLSTGQVQQVDATDHSLPDEAATIWFTDPPYYDAIPYADLADFFVVWLKRTLPYDPLPQDSSEPSKRLSPKDAEVVQDNTKQVDGEPKNRGWFEQTMARTFAEGRRTLSDEGIGSVVFAHKTTEGWEALLSGLVQGGWTITGSWPIATESSTRLRARDSAALATSVHLICRPRLESAPVGDWADVLRELPVRVEDWIERLQLEGIRGADLVFACIGPALEIFSRYRGVETAAGRTVELPEYLEKVWEVVGRAALKQVLGGQQKPGDNGLAGALEEDARLTALFLWTLQSTDAPTANGKRETDNTEAEATAAAQGFTLPYDVVRRFAQPMGIDLDLWKDRIIGQKKGVVRLLPVSERAKELFGEEGAGMAAHRIEQDASVDPQGALFADLDATRLPVAPRGGRVREGDAEFRTRESTTLDRVHAAMLLQASGHANALRRLIEAELDRGPDFLRLANALSALYPRGSREKRLLDAMLLAVPR
jgi:adenine-specific DNA methylase